MEIRPLYKMSQKAMVERKRQMLVKTLPLPLGQSLAFLTTASSLLLLNQGLTGNQQLRWGLARLRVSADISEPTPAEVCLHITQSCSCVCVCVCTGTPTSSAPTPATTAVAEASCSLTGRWHQGTICKHCLPKPHDGCQPAMALEDKRRSHQMHLFLLMVANNSHLPLPGTDPKTFSGPWW